MGLEQKSAIVKLQQNKTDGAQASLAEQLIQTAQSYHAPESRKAACEKAKALVEKLRSMKLKYAAKKLENGIEETLIYCDFPSKRWTRIRTNNVIERLNRGIRRCTRIETIPRFV